MEYRQFGNHYVVRMDRGDEILTKLVELCRKEDIKVGSAVGLGAADRVELGLFDTTEKKYYKKELTGLMEISSLIGNISTKDGEPYLHFHINVCGRDLNATGGHLSACYVSATAEITVTKLEGTVERKMSDEVGLNLYEFQAE